CCLTIRGCLWKGSEPTLYLFAANVFSYLFLFVVLAVYLNQCWWPVEDVVKTADPSRDGLISVQTFGERIVLFVLNYIIFGMLEGSSANDAFFLPHSATECAKILWRNGEAVAFYSVKMKGSLCDGTTSQCYLLPVLDTIFVRRKYRRSGLGMKMLDDFCQSFVAEDALGISCPISAAMYQVCQKFLQTYPEEQKRLWEVEAPGDWSQRVNIWLKIQMERAHIVSFWKCSEECYRANCSHAFPHLSCFVLAWGPSVETLLFILSAASHRRVKSEFSPRLGSSEAIIFMFLML
uniref:Family with sequence similarity 169 member B n=1 Tax=Strigops habroptila TaxID=2489341 RepID=A0A672V071_STRHB